MMRKICRGLLLGLAIAALGLSIGCGKAEEEIDLPGFQVLLAGAEGHGRTTLLAAMTQVLAERGLAEEQSYDELVAAGATGKAEVAFNSAGHRIALIDHASHAGIVASLGSGAVNAMVLVVAQTDGISQQTREQIAAAGAAAIPPVIVFLSKGDLVDDEELRDLVQSEIEQALAEAGLLAEEEAGTWEGGSFQPGTTEVYHGSARQALESDPGARAAIGALVDAIDRRAGAV